MNVARLNMCHGSHDWHKEVITHIRQLNKSKGCAIAVDTANYWLTSVTVVADACRGARTCAAFA